MASNAVDASVSRRSNKCWKAFERLWERPRRVSGSSSWRGKKSLEYCFGRGVWTDSSEENLTHRKSVKNWPLVRGDQRSPTALRPGSVMYMWWFWEVCFWEELKISFKDRKMYPGVRSFCFISRERVSIGDDSGDNPNHFAFYLKMRWLLGV